MDLPVEIVKLLLAILVGGLIGAEREYRDKAAGFRTLIFICVGSALITSVSMRIGGVEDPVRIAANIVTGVGFLGAGAIMRDSGRVLGLTTAATIWLVAALGIAIGGGLYMIAISATLVVLGVLVIFPKIEHLIDNARHVVHYEVICANDREHYQKVEKLFQESGLQLRRIQRAKSEGKMVCCWQVTGTPAKHEILVDQLLTCPEVIEFSI